MVNTLGPTGRTVQSWGSVSGGVPVRVPGICELRGQASLIVSSSWTGMEADLALKWDQTWRRPTVQVVFL